MNWKQSLDRYLTTEPDNGYNSWCEHVTDNFSDEFFTQNEEWIMDDNSSCSACFFKLFNEGTEPHEAAQIIEKQFLDNLQKY